MIERHIRPLGAEEAGRGDEDGEALRDAGDGERGPQEGHEAVEENGAQPAAVEDPAVRAARDPGQPTRAERAVHELTHLPFRPWCADCVAGKAADDPHRRLARAVDEGPPKVSVDYGFVTEGDETKTVLVVKAAGCKAIMARCVRGKGRADPLAASWLVDQLRRLGLGRCVCCKRTGSRHREPSSRM